MNLEHTSRAVLEQNKRIELFRDDDIQSIVHMIVCEALELAEATETAFLTDDLTAVVSESADCLYLLIRLFDSLGIDERAVDMKHDRNEDKYLGKESKEQAIIEWKKRGGDKKFFEDYLNSV